MKWEGPDLTQVKPQGFPCLLTSRASDSSLKINGPAGVAQ